MCGYVKVPYNHRPLREGLHIGCAIVGCLSRECVQAKRSNLSVRAVDQGF